MNTLPEKVEQSHEVEKRYSWIMNGRDYANIKDKITEIKTVLDTVGAADLADILSDISTLQSDLDTAEQNIIDLQEYIDGVPITKKYAAFATQDNTEVVAGDGALDTGVTYQVFDYKAGDDFSNFGITNENGQEFSIGDLAGSVAHTQANVTAVKQKDTITLTGTDGTATIAGAGGLSFDLNFNTLLATTATDFYNAHVAAYLAQGIVLTHLGDDIIFEASVAGKAFDHPTITNKPHTITGTNANTQANVTAVKQKDTVTLTGTSGTAAITGAGLEAKLATFNGTLGTTASDFVTAHAATYDAAGVVVTADGVDLVFEAKVAGTPFTSPTVLNLSGDLDGTVVNTTANRVAVKQKNTLTLSGGFGTCNVTGTGGLTKLVTFNADLGTTASDFVTAHAAAYLAEGIVVTSNVADIIFEAQVAGVAFTVPAAPAIPKNLAGTVANTVANRVAVSQVETITFTGTSGISKIEAAGGLGKNIIFNTDLQTTVANFITTNAAAYLAQAIVLSQGVGGNVNKLIMTAQTAGTGFTPPTVDSSSVPNTWTNGTVLIKDYQINLTEMQNNVGQIIWERTGVGISTGTCADAFVAGSTFIPASNVCFVDVINEFCVTLERTSKDVITLKTYTSGEGGYSLSDGILNNFPIEFTIYPAL